MQNESSNEPLLVVSNNEIRLLQSIATELHIQSGLGGGRRSRLEFGLWHLRGKNYSEYFKPINLNNTVCEQLRRHNSNTHKHHRGYKACHNANLFSNSPTNPFQLWNKKEIPRRCLAYYSSAVSTLLHALETWRMNSNGKCSVSPNIASQFIQPAFFEM